MLRRWIRRCRTVALAAALLCGVGCEGDGDGGGEPRMTQARWNETIAIGMTESEVNAALGRAPDREFDDWFYWRFDRDEGGVRYDGARRVNAHRWVTNMY